VDIPDDILAELRALGRKVQRFDEAGKTYIYVEGHQLPEGCDPPMADVLLCPQERDGYPSRLFFSQRVTSASGRQFVHEARIAERQWYAISWRVDRTDLRPAQLIAAHLRALR